MKRKIREDFELAVAEALGMVPENIKLLRLQSGGYNHPELSRMWTGFKLAADIYLKEEKTNVHGEGGTN